MYQMISFACKLKISLHLLIKNNFIFIIKAVYVTQIFQHGFTIQERTFLQRNAILGL